MSHHFALQPLFFASLDSFLDARRQVKRADLQDFMTQFGFDNRGYKSKLTLGKNLPNNWIARYFSPDDETFLTLPFRMPGIGVPFDHFKQGGTEFTPNMESFFKDFLLGQPVTIADAMKKDHYVLRSVDANRLKSVVDDALMFAGGAHSILKNTQESDKRVTKQVINGVDKGNTSRIFTVPTDPVEFQQQSQKYKEDLSKIMPFVNDGQILGLVNFANGVTVDGQPREIAYQKLAQPKWDTGAQSKIADKPLHNGYIYVSDIGKRIKQSGEIPGKSQHVYREDFLADRFHARKRYKAELQHETWSRFAEQRGQFV